MQGPCSLLASFGKSSIAIMDSGRQKPVAVKTYAKHRATSHDSHQDWHHIYNLSTTHLHHMQFVKSRNKKDQKVDTPGKSLSQTPTGGSKINKHLLGLCKINACIFYTLQDASRAWHRIRNPIQAGVAPTSRQHTFRAAALNKQRQGCDYRLAQTHLRCRDKFPRRLCSFQSQLALNGRNYANSSSMSNVEATKHPASEL